MLVIPGLSITGSRCSYYPNLCAVCFNQTAGKELTKCSGCKLISYCGKEHQKAHWQAHKQLCKAVQILIKRTDSVGLFDGFSGVGFDKWCKFADGLIYICEKILNRKLRNEECTLFLNPLKCRLCHIYRRGQMVSCTKCNVISYCSELHKENDQARHALVCDELKYCLDFDMECKKPFLVFGSIDDVATLPVNMQTFINECMRVNTVPKIKTEYINLFVSDFLSIVLTIIYVIEKSAMHNNSMKETFNIHIVGSGTPENAAGWCWEYIFHYFKRIHTINIVFIGPESADNFLPPVLICENCKNSRSISFTVKDCLYHEFIQNSSIVPDVIIAFNCGFHADLNWKNSLPSLCRFNGAVVAFTSYTLDESKKDLDVIKTFSKNVPLNILVEFQENPFRSLLPNAAWINNENGSVYYNNYYISVLIS